MAGVHSSLFSRDDIAGRLEKGLVANGLITKDQLLIAKISQENLGIDLGSVLIRKGFINENNLLQFMAEEMGIKFMSLKDLSPDAELVRKIPQHIARQHMAIPLYLNDKGEAIVAMSNPFDTFAKDDIKEFLRLQISPVLAAAAEIEKTLLKFYESGAAEDADIVTVEISTENENTTETEAKKIQEMALGPKIVAAVNHIISRAASEKASDIHLEPTRGKVMIRYRVDGLLRDKGSLAKTMHLPVVSRIKILAGLDIAERRIPQDGRVRVLLVGKPLDMRVSTCPTQHGEKVVIRLLAKDAVRSIESIGFSEKERRTFSDIITKSHGIFLATGPTGSGKSTTLYAALSRINSPEKNIISIEDPIENEIEGVNQVAVNTKTGLSFAAVLRSVLRQDPDVIMIGEIRDAETAQIAVRAAITGHMVLSTLHTNTAAGCISRLCDLGVEPFLLASALKGVMAQRLVRKICIHCREEISPEEVQGAALLDRKLTKAFRGKGCKECGFTGYKGRAGIFELAPITEEVRHLIHTAAADEDVVKSFRKMGVKSIIEDGLEKVEQGTTTLDEVFRVTQEE